MTVDGQTFTYSEEWLREAVRVEDACGCDVEVGAWLLQYPPSAPLSPVQVQSMMKMVRLQEIIFVELRRWMESWNLGVALEDALTCARQRVRHHLLNPTNEQQAYFDSLLTEDRDNSTETVIRQQLLPTIYSWLTPDDWNAIAQAASQSVIQQIQSIAS